MVKHWACFRDGKNLFSIIFQETSFKIIFQLNKILHETSKDILQNVFVFNPLDFLKDFCAWLSSQLLDLYVLQCHCSRI